MRIIQKVFICLIFSAFSTLGFAQKLTISGKVTDKSTGEELPGVSVFIKGSSTGAITDEKGAYRLEVQAQDILMFSFIGYTSIEIPVNNRTVVDVTLSTDIEALSEVVVMGYGSQQKKEISGSVSNITPKDFNQGVVRDASDLLQGRVAGLVITQAGGDVTASSTIRLRGTASLKGGSAPFIVIDGVPNGDLSSIAPQDIESISVLKDAASAAIYGSRSASGVILVSTKKGKAGRTTVSYDGFAAMDIVSNKPEMLNAEEWRTLSKNLGHDITAFDKGADTDWFDEILRTAISHNHSVSLTGGTEKSNYRATATYLNRQGVVKNNDYERLNTRFTISQKALNDKLLLNFTGIARIADFSPSDKRNFMLAYNRIPVLPVKKEDGTWDESNLGEHDQGNPVHNIELNKFDTKHSYIQGNFNGKYTVLPGLVADASVSISRFSSDYAEFLHSETERGFKDKGFAKRESKTKDIRLMELTLNYNRTFNFHKFDLLGGYSWEETKDQSSRVQNRGFLTDYTGANDMGAGSGLRSDDVFSNRSMSRLISFFGRLNYSYKERYMASLSIRNDGSSKFGKNHKWGVFPSASVAWRITEEAFLKGATGSLSDLKFRVGYGITGNQDGLDPYKTLSIFGQDGFYLENGEWRPAYKIAQNANPDLKWEQTAMLNVGVDFEFFKGRISGSVEWYNKKTTDMLYEYKVPTPPYVHDKMMANVGEMSNKGIEVYLNAYPIQGQFTWNFSLNFAHNKNKIQKLSGGQFTTERVYVGNPGIRGGSNTTTHVVEEGYPVGTFFGWKVNGIKDGKYVFEDLDGKDGINENDRTHIGDAQPDFTFGISNSFSYKNFDLSFFLRGVVGNKVLNSSRMQYATTAWLPGANVLRESLTLGLNEAPKYSSFYLENGSYVRLDNVSLGYTFKNAKLAWLQKCRVFFTGQNLFVITGYKGLDPEVNMDGLEPGVESKEFYPRSRTFSLGLSLNF